MREYKYDNLKFLLIFLVVFAHLLELSFTNINMNIYKYIYMFHMPAFVFITGYFARNFKKNALTYMYIYLIWQPIYFLFFRYVLNQSISFTYLKPNWVLWYIMAVCVWNLIMIILNKLLTNENKLYFLLLSFAFSILAGFNDEIGYTLSLGRIFTFFPYFLMGYLYKNHKFNLLIFENHKTVKQKFKIFIYVILLIFSTLYFSINIEKIKYQWLYGSYSYALQGYTPFFKMMWILISVLELILLINIVPNKKIQFVSYIGANTLTIYLLHGLIIKIILHYWNIMIIPNLNILIALFLTAVLLVTFGNNFIRKFLKYLIMPQRDGAFWSKSRQ
jgi:fucose 4-O-acetylase-like acetyltransferase